MFDKSELTETSSGFYNVSCPSCGADGNDYGGLTLFPKTNTAYCHNSRKWFTLKETFALIKGIIQCIEGRSKE